MELKAIRPKMRGMSEEDGVAQIVIEATQEEATKIGHLLFMPVCINFDETYKELDFIGEYIGNALVKDEDKSISFSHLIRHASDWFESHYNWRPTARVLGGMLKERLKIRKSRCVEVLGYRMRDELDGLDR